MKLKKYIKNNLLALDRLLNALAGGDSRELVSSRLGKNPHCSWIATGMYYLLNWLDPNHCEDSREFEHKDIGSHNVF